MLRKFLLLGILSIVTSACLPHAGLLTKKPLQEPVAVQEQPSLFTSPELEKILSSEPSAPLSAESEGNRDAKTPGYPMGDDSNEDFDLTASPEKEADPGPKFDIPIVINEKVEQFIQFFQTTARANFSIWLSRSERYLPFMKGVLKENGLPEDLVYLALIESGFNPYAYSRSKASGPWQFISPTGKRYGLKVDLWVDERRDPEKSTLAAAKYLKDLYVMFECWYLAAAGYNAGENRILGAMKRYRTEDFWELSKYRYLKQETRDYVPQLIAAALIAKSPEKYGFNEIAYQEPLRYDRVRVPCVTDLRCIAKACGIGLEELRGLNPELIRKFTPPDPSEYEIKIPFGTKDLFLKNFDPNPGSEKYHFKTHIVKKGQTVLGIAKLYKTKIDPLLEINELNIKSRLSPGMTLLIPIPIKPAVKTATAPEKLSRREGHSKSSSGSVRSGG